MKSKFYLLLLLPLLFVSCKKWLPENRIVGTWRLVDVEKRRLLDRDNITTGYETGVFSFNENGSAAYRNTTDTLTGSWHMRKDGWGYTDADGQWHGEQRTVFTVRLYNFNTNQVIDWYFDRIDFRNGGDKLFAYIDGAAYTYRYDFRKQ